MPNPIRVGIIGLGFMGRTHLAAYRSAAPAGFDCRLIAVADVNPGSATPAGNLGPSQAPLDLTGIARHDSAAELLARDDLDLVSICTPTDTHADLAIAALAGGKHVLLEKPVALLPADVVRTQAARAASSRLCMPAMVMRFWPGWTHLHDCIKDQRHGPLRSATFTRLGSRPAWNPDFYHNPARSGGALFDLHIHDADFILWCLGQPVSTTTHGSIDHVTTAYHFKNTSSSHPPLHVVAEGGWDQHPGWPFRMRFLANFAHATLDFDLSRPSPLHIVQSGESKPLDLPGLAPGSPSGYDLEVRHILSAIADLNAGRTPTLRATLDDALAVTTLLAAARTALAAS